MGKHRDWTDIRAEYERGKSLPRISETHGISLSTLKKVCSREGWIKGKAEIDRLAEKVKTAQAKMAPEPKGTVETAPTRDAPRETAERILCGLLDDVARMVGAVGSTKELRELTSSFKDLWGLLNAKDELDREEQAARIAKLRAETRTEETMEEKAVVVRFIGTGGAEK